ncbi:ComEC/Rec2 family competence protein [Robertkochia aurantiaca]|uniref:ComEC/Rec2 family competence protein n=1 Tax=Robertkochia aurantiaca TaxID=2873700 RepID=UPI001CCD74D6|nr:ComEC/Rec2 family competence protein [Robertkochia sp. 3YJGBD-33]
MGVNFPIATITSGFLTGILIGAAVHELNTVCTISGVIVLFSVFLLIRKLYHHACFWFLIFILAGIFSQKVSQSDTPDSHYSRWHNENTMLFLRIKEPLTRNEKSATFSADVIQAGHHRCTGTVLVVADPDQAQKDIKPGVILITRESPEPIPSAKNPYQFDYRSYMATQNIFHRVKTESYYIPQLTSDNFYNKLQALRFRLSDSLDNRIRDPEARQLAQALVFGRKDLLDRSLRQSYIRSGSAHLLAISGLHLGIISSFFYLLLFPLRYFPPTRRYLPAFMIILLWCYASVTGLGPSVLRSVVMFSFLSLTLLQHKYQNVVSLLFISALLLTIFRPAYLFETGFQLSYAAVFGICCFHPVLRSYYKPGHRAARYLYDLFLAGLAAQIGVLPLLLFHFHEVSVFSLISGVFLVPLLTALVILALILSLVPLPGLLLSFVNSTFSFLVNLMNGIIEFGASVSGFRFTGLFFTGGMALGLTAAILFLWLWLKRKKFVHIIPFCLAFLFTQAVYLHAWQTRPGRLYILHGYRKSSALAMTNHQTELWSQETLKKDLIEPVMREHLAEGYQQREAPLKSEWGDKTLIRLDSLGYTGHISGNNKIVWLSYSPPVNMDRLIETSSPEVIVADGSNSPFLVKRWKQSAAKKNIPFHYTGEKGYFMIETGN